MTRGAVRHFLARGSVDMDRLATDLAISRATLYRVAGSRDALLGEVFWLMGCRLLDDARTARTKDGPDGVIEVSRIFTDRFRDSEPMRAFVGAEPETAARVLFTPSGEVHRRIIGAQQEAFADAGVPADFRRAFLYVRVMESVLYGELISGEPVGFATAESALRAILNGM